MWPFKKVSFGHKVLGQLGIGLAETRLEAAEKGSLSQLSPMNLAGVL